MPVLNIVMVEPEIPRNTGNVARTCTLTGARLHPVGPFGFRIDGRRLKRAGLDCWHLLDITLYESLSEFFARNSGNFFYFSTKGRRVHSEVAYPDGCHLVFGKETAGLPERLLHDNPDACSLNLSNAVAVGAYEVLRQWNYPGLLREGKLWEFRW